MEKDIPGKASTNLSTSTSNINLQSRGKYYTSFKILNLFLDDFSSIVVEETNRTFKQTNKNTGGVDRFDQMMQYYAYPHRFKKWWKFFFVYLMEMAILNFYIVYSNIRKLYYDENVIYLDFRLEIATIYTGFVTIGRLSNTHSHRQKESKAVYTNLHLPLDRRDANIAVL